jgi:hypothetical protein
MSGPLQLSQGLLKRSGTSGLATNQNSQRVVIPVCIDCSGCLPLPVLYPIAQPDRSIERPTPLSPRHNLQLDNHREPPRLALFREVSDAKVCAVGISSSSQSLYLRSRPSENRRQIKVRAAIFAENINAIGKNPADVQPWKRPKTEKN